jgi:hypothetical protein
VKTVLEIEQAIQQMPAQQRWEIARWLLDGLRGTPNPQGGTNVVQAGALPDYSARRRRIFGDKVLPNLVLAARAEESR